jgi:2-keto-3-deoxy-L-rhamnonate aldolase RhmA
MQGSLKSALSSGRLVRVFALGQLCGPKLVEMVGLVGGYDAVWLDQEHVGLSVPQIEEACRAGRAVGLDVFVRLAATDYTAVMRPLEAGACGVMAAMVRHPREAHDLVRWAKFHPAGARGVNGGGVDADYGRLAMDEYLRQANERTVLGVQVEHIDAVGYIDELSAISEIDFLFIGPADLSQSMGIPGEWDHPRLWEAIERVGRACAGNGRAWAILPPSPAAARRCVEMGCRMLSVGVDNLAFQRGVRTFQEQYAEWFRG